MGDSSLIIERLKEVYQDNPDDHLTGEERGIAVAIERLVEENLYWAMVYDRWCRTENWATLKDSVLGDIPQPLRAILAPQCSPLGEEAACGAWHGTAFTR